MFFNASIQAQDVLLTKRWDDLSGKHKLIVTRGDLNIEQSEFINIQQTTNGESDWQVNDYVKECDNDIVLDLYSNIVDVNDFFSDGDMTVFFAYKLDCTGGISAANVKYFAVHKGVKYILRGKEQLVSDSYPNDPSDKVPPPTPNYNLMTNNKLLEYMKKKWPEISTRKY